MDKKKDKTPDGGAPKVVKKGGLGTAVGGASVGAGLVGKGAIDKQKFIEQASAKRIGRVSGADWRFSKYRGMFFVSQLESNKMTANKIVDQIAAYSLSATNDSAPHVVYK